MFSGKVRGFKELYAVLDQLPAAVGEKEMQKGLHELARPMVIDARISATQSKSIEPRHPQGHLCDHIDSFTRNSHGKWVKVAVGYPIKFFWGGWVEWGKEGVPARPFLRTAWDGHKYDLLPRFGEIMWERLAKVLARAARGAGR
jgi:hypothetical protein